MKDDLVLCAIAKCENKYIKEWVQWHFNIGFDKIVVYDNNDVNGEKISDAIGDVPCVEIIDWRGKTQKSCETQVAAYNDCYKKHMNSKWIMFLDIDEFLEFREGVDLISFLEQDWVKHANDIKFHWKCYSDNGYVKAPSGLVTENFTRECKNKTAVNCYVKHMYRCGLPKLSIMNVHYSSSLTNVYYQNGKTAPYLTITVDKNINHDVGWIRHYVTKSMEEFVFTKYARRGPGTSKNRLNVDFYFKYNTRTPEKEQQLREMINKLEPQKEETKSAKIEKPNKEAKTSWVIEPYYANKSYPGKNSEKQKAKEADLSKRDINEQDTYPGGLSICISAWNVEKYIEECLDSIVSQSWIKKHSNYEILIGIDHCEKTLEKLMSISDKYKDYNLKVFMMDKNVGTYIVSNTLMKEGKYRWLMRFDSDDVMCPGMIEKTLKYAVNERVDVLQPYAINFGSRTNPIFTNHGCVLIKKVVFEKFGGYRPWKCAADTELIVRLRKYSVCRKYENIVFKRRVHSENLTCRKDTGMKSDLRQQYKKQTVVPATIKQATIKLVTESFTMVKLNVVEETPEPEPVADEVEIDGISICITAYKSQDYIEECLNSVVAQTWFEKHDNWEIIVGIDGCERTLLKMKEIMHKYKNLRVLMLDRNRGTYVTTNTIIKQTKYNWVLRFDSDDIMRSYMVESAVEDTVGNDFIRFGFKNFGVENPPKKFGMGWGVVLLNKSILNKLGGYKEWRCGGDADMIRRFKYSGCKIFEDTRILFDRRIHANSLTQDVKTNFDSDLRKQTLAEVKSTNYALWSNRIANFTTENFTEITPESGICTNIVNLAAASDADIEEFLYNRAYNSRFKLQIDFKNPKTVQEKLNYLMVYDNCKMLKAKCADKILLHDYSRRKLGKDICVPIIDVYDKPEDIDFDKLPNKYVLKCNHGYAMNIICTDNKNNEFLKIKNREINTRQDCIDFLNTWLDTNFGDEYYQWHYALIEPKCYAEVFMDDGHESLMDYKVWCCNGEPKMIMVISDRYSNNLHENIYDVNWNTFDIGWSCARQDFDNLDEKPVHLDEMLEYSRKLSEDFDFVRVDFYVINDKIYLGELTFSPNGGIFGCKDEETSLYWGDMINITSF